MNAVHIFRCRCLEADKGWDTSHAQVVCTRGCRYHPVCIWALPCSCFPSTEPGSCVERDAAPLSQGFTQSGVLGGAPRALGCFDVSCLGGSFQWWSGLPRHAAILLSSGVLGRCSCRLYTDQPEGRSRLTEWGVMIGTGGSWGAHSMQGAPQAAAPARSKLLKPWPPRPAPCTRGLQGVRGSQGLHCIPLFYSLVSYCPGWSGKQ